MGKTENLDLILTAPQQDEGMDILLVTTTSQDLEAFWQQRLEKTRGAISPQHCRIYVVYEDWPGGAGNGLGTLYALHKAERIARERDGISILDMLDDGASVGLYHTAGKGTRLAPLPGSENNNKPAVKLPGRIVSGDEHLLMTILEAVILQTGVYAKSRKGRVSVFWGDQVFIPSAPVIYQPTHHVDILAALAQMPSAEEWKARGLEKYGLIAVAANGDAAQVEKIDHATACSLIEKKVIQVDGGIGISLGSFSISSVITRLLLEEFAQELEEKKIALDTDPHFWMPLTLDEQTYLEIMLRKGEREENVLQHYRRMGRLKETLCAKAPQMGVFGCVDIGDAAYWWDYGTIPGYIDNNRKLLGDDEEAQAMRRFFHIEPEDMQAPPGVEVEGRCIVLDSNINRGKLKNAIVAGVVADEIFCEDALIINSAFTRLEGNEILLYNVVEPVAVQFKPGQVRADIFHPGQVHWKMLTTMNRDGKKDWDVCLPGNPMSYAELHRTNQNISLKESLSEAQRAFQGLAEQIRKGNTK
ncbi:MAG: hypothetical protein D6820_17105 [Lentisphaerae bacterium]|nr:MAG: hypothetical protein D6820_17105 [Lentisphaerota bacterium]